MQAVVTRVLASCPGALRGVTRKAPSFRRSCPSSTLPSLKWLSGFPFVVASRSIPEIQQRERSPSSGYERTASDGTTTSSMMTTDKYTLGSRIGWSRDEVAGTMAVVPVLQRNEDVADVRKQTIQKEFNNLALLSANVNRTPFLADPAQLVASVETFVFDCDGVIWNGNKLMDQVGETLDLLRALGKRIFFLTNNSTKSRKQYGKKCESLGLNVREEEVFSSGFAAVEYLKSVNYPANKKVYVISEAGVQMELEQAGFQWLGGPGDDDKKIDARPGKTMEHDRNVGAVVIGFDRHVNYYKIQYATLCLRENPGCLFIASNCDDVVQLNDSHCWAGEGAIVGAIKGATNREPIVAGKPSTFMMEYLAKKFKTTSSQICMVGDKLDTDILFGHNGGCKTLLVLSGVTDLETLQSPENEILPDYYTHKVSDLLAAKFALGSCAPS